MKSIAISLASAACVLVCVSVASAGELTVVSTQPAAGAMGVARSTSISVTFNQPVNPATVTVESFHAFGRWTGPVTGALSFSNGDQTVTLMPERTFTSGDPIKVVLSSALQSADGSSLRDAGYAYSFMTIASEATMEFKQIDSMSAATPGWPAPRIYGGMGTDLDLDGWLDITLVCEDSADLRVMLNLGDGSGLFGPILLPTNPVGSGASPNEQADFNHDGLPDVATANDVTDDVTIVLGNGDGTFGPAQSVEIGGGPHGLACLDIDGDGDMDLAAANTGTNKVTLVINNGTGVFSLGASIESGGNGEYALTAADMNNDRIEDLVVGAMNSQTIIVLRGNGDGTFTSIETQSAGGAVWMITAGDVNGDGNIDVTSANGSSGSGSILLGDGTGQLAAPQVYSSASGAVATDLSDWDGDGDLDWILSHFGGGVWRVYLNNGSGAFTFDQQFIADSNCACAASMDFDNDGDMDLVLFDEIANTVRLMQNSSTPPNPADLNSDGDVDGFDLAVLLAAWGPCRGACPADLDGDGDVDGFDLAMLLAAWS